MGASPLLPRFILPPLNRDRLKPDPGWFTWAAQALKSAADNGELHCFGGISSGLIATGARFIEDASLRKEIRDALPGLKAVEREGGAVAQVAEQEGIPWLLIRVISDGADESAAQSFTDFVQVYEQQAWRLIEALLRRLNNP